MSLIDELRQAAVELAMDQPITQERWAAALVDGWMRDTSIGWALVRAAGLDGVAGDVPAAKWEALRNQAAVLSPPLPKFTSLKNKLKVWLPKVARFANDALWDGRPEAARRLMAKGGARSTVSAETKAALMDEAKKDRGRLIVRVRERDTRNGWKTVK